MNKLFFAAGIVLCFIASPLVCGQAAGYWHTSGNQILDANNAPIRISGVNWYGFETTDEVVHGLWAQDYKAILNTIHSNGYNTIRIPFSNQMVESGFVPTNVSYSNGSGAINTDLQGLMSLQILDKVVAYAGQVGLHIILDNHRSEAGNSAEANGLWYTSSYPESAWINDWVTLANRYKGNSTIIGFDLRNEPHNATSGGSCWGCGSSSNDWRLAAERGGNAVLAVNANLLIFVEGTDCYNNDCDWWGGNLEGVSAFPVILNGPSNLVYSAHDYGPSVYGQSWFNGSTTESSLAAVWTKFWAYISLNGTAPVWLGEFGTPNSASDISSSTPGSEGQWFQSMIQFLSTNSKLGWTYWALNGEDSLALLDSNYDSTPLNAAKQQALASIQFNGGSGTTASCQSIPSVPQGLNAAGSSPSQINVSWTAVTPASNCHIGYSVYESKTPGLTPSSSTLIASSLSSPNYASTGLTAGATYYFALVATDAAGSSAATPDVSATTPGATTPTPAAPSNLNASATSPTSIQLTWQASVTSGVTYNVYRSQTADFTIGQGTRVASGIAATGFANSGLSASTTYYYLVTAVSSGNESAASNSASATTPAATTAGASCHVVYTANSVWNVGFNVSLTIQNTSSTAINNWTLSWTWGSNQTVTQAWNSNLVQAGPTVVLTNASWNAGIAPGATINGVGINGAYTGSYVSPTTFYLNGTLCR